MELKRNYLTNEELIFVVDTISQESNIVAREFLKVGIVGQFLIDDLANVENCNEAYDKIMEANIDLNQIVNYKTIDELVNKMHSTEMLLKDFLDNIEKVISESAKKLPKDLKGFQMDKFLEQMKEVIKSA